MHLDFIVSVRGLCLFLCYLQHTKYELVEDMAPATYNFTHHARFCVHCNFYAKDSSTLPFFAEICMVSPLDLDITCVILTGQIYVGCEYCHSLIIHPVCRYPLAYPNYSRHASLSISGRDEDPWKGPNLDMEIVKKDEDSGNKTPDTTPIYQQEDSSKGTTDSPRIPASPPYRQASKTSSGQFLQGTRKDHIINANLALGYYNNKNKTNFKLVEHEAIKSTFFLDDRLSYVNCFFNATDSSVKQFFAKISVADPLQPVVKTCEILEGKCYVGCECTRFFIHPDGEYLAGHPSYLRFSKDDPDKEFVEKDKDSAHETPGYQPYSPPYKPLYPAYPPPSPTRRVLFDGGDSMEYMYK
ncbi:hypothetical protein Leryth_006550 [Lithospermum erythrorhizon]|nr:hypothetical protein Leryth_006550 [Lithospermum erythrorhizon]